MRVVFLTHNFPRWPGDVSGSFLVPLAAALVRRGHGVTVVAPSDGGEVGAPELDGIPVRRVRYATPAHETLAYRGTMASAVRSPLGLAVLAGLLRALRTATRDELARGHQVVHAHWWVPAAVAAPPGAPLVVTAHGTDAALLRRSALARAVARPVLRRARVVTAVSAAAAESLALAGARVPADRIQPMPLDAGRFRRSTGGGGAVVVARLTAQKRVGLAIAAVARLRTRGRALPLRIVGDGPLRAELEAQAAAAGVADLVTFTGARPPEAIPDLLADADLSFLPAEQEGFGLSAVESLVAGVPVVGCRDGGGIVDIAGAPGAGRVVAPDPDALADAAAALLDHPGRHDDALAAGTAWSDRLAPDRVAAACERWYEEALRAA